MVIIVRLLCFAIKPLGFMALTLALHGCGTHAQQHADEARVKTFTVSLANIHIVDAGAKRLMIDAGKHGDEATLVAAMQAEGIDPRSIDYLIITHGHTDHAGGARYFKEHFGTRIIAGRADQAMLASGKNAALCSTTVLASFLKPSIQRESYPPVSADIWVAEALDLAAFGAKGRIVSLPSHTPGSIAVLIDDQAFVGDLVRGELLSKTQPARHFYMCDLKRNDKDITTLLDNQGIKTWYTGHMGPVSTPAVREVFK
jgi:hydroxyacylglutathione hydrolase